MFSKGKHRNPLLADDEPLQRSPRSPGYLAQMRLNPFRDPSPPETTPAKSRDKQKKHNNSPYYMSGAINEEEDEISNTSHSGDTEGSTRTESTIDRSYVHPFAPSRDYDHSTEINGKGFTNTPSRRKQGTKPMSNRLGQIYHGFSSPASPFRNVNNKINPSPVRESPRSGVHHNLLGAGLKRFSIVQSPTYTREVVLLKTAAQQQQLLENERMKNANPASGLPRLHPTPKASARLDSRRGLGERDISSTQGLVSSTIGHDSADGRLQASEKAIGRRKALRNSTFWIFFGLIQVGLVSTGAAVAIIFLNGTPGERTHASAGAVLWLVISLLAIVVGSLGALCVWGIGREGCVDLMGKIGLAELGLMPNLGGNDIEKSAREREEEYKRMNERLERVRERERERARIRATSSKGSVRTIDPEWQALYATPEDLRHAAGRRGRGTSGGTGETMEMEIFAGESVRKTPRRSRNAGGVESLITGGTSLTEFNECDIGMQVLTPTRVSAASRCQQPENPNAGGPNNRFPFSRFQGMKLASDEDFTPPYLRGRKKSGPVVIVNGSEGAATLEATEPSGTLHRELSKHLSKDFTIAPLTPAPDLSPPTTDGGNKQENGISPSPTVDLYTALAAQQSQCQRRNTNASTNRDTLLSDSTPLDSFSPLENLAMEFNNPELRNLSAEKRVDYLVERRSLNEERGRKVRESLERGGSFSGSLSWRSSGLRAEVEETEAESDGFRNVTRDPEHADITHRQETGLIVCDELSEMSKGNITSKPSTATTTSSEVNIPGAFPKDARTVPSSPELDLETTTSAHNDDVANPKKPVISSTTREVNPMITERARNLQEKDGDGETGKAGATSLARENGWVETGTKNLSAANGVEGVEVEKKGG